MIYIFALGGNISKLKEQVMSLLITHNNRRLKFHFYIN